MTVSGAAPAATPGALSPPPAAPAPAPVVLGAARVAPATVPSPPAAGLGVGPRLGLWVVGLAALGLAPTVLPSYVISVLTEVLIFAIFVISLDLLVGYTGLTSLGHALFFGVSGYIVGWVSRGVTSEFLLTLPAGMLAAATLAAITGALAVRVRGVYFLMVTLAGGEMFHAAATQWIDVTGGENGLSGIPRPTGLLASALGVSFFPPVPFYLLNLAVFAVSLALLRRVVHSPFGRVLTGIRENEGRMLALGFDTQRYKLGAFVIAGTFAGVAGSLHAAFNGIVSPQNLHWTTSATALIMVIIGGKATLLGPVLGAALFLCGQNVLSSHTDRWPLLMGLLFIAVVYAGPRGLIGFLARWGRPRRWGARWRRGPGDRSDRSDRWKH